MHVVMFLKVFSEYFKELEEESIRDNFVIIYELMDELMDFGYPQTTDSKILQEWVFLYRAGQQSRLWMVLCRREMKM